MGDTFRARSAPERRADQCPGSNRHRWIKKLNLSPNISATPSHLPSSVTDTASVARPATNVRAFVTPNAGRASTLGLSRSLRDTVGEQEQRDSLARQMGSGINDLRRSLCRP